MMNLKKYSGYVLLLLLLAAFGIVLEKCNRYKKKLDDQDAVIQFQNNEITTLKNDSGRIVAQQKVAIASNTEVIKSLSAQLFNLKSDLEKKMKEVRTLVSAQQVFVVKDTMIQYNDIAQGRNPDSLVRLGDVIMPPRSFSDSNKYYSIHGKVLLAGVQIDSAKIYNQLSFRIGEQKKNLFTSQLVVQAVNSNPHIQVTGINSIVLKNKPNAWNRWIKPALVGAAASFVTYKITH